MAALTRFIILNVACILSFYNLTESCGLYLLNAQSLAVVIWIYYRSMKSDKKLPLCSLLACLGFVVLCSIGLIYLYKHMESSPDNIGHCSLYFDNLINLRDLVSSGEYTTIIQDVSDSIKRWIPQAHWDDLKLEELKYSTVANRALSYWQNSWSTIIVTAHILVTLLILILFHTCTYSKSDSKRLLTATVASPKNGGRYQGHITMYSSSSPRVHSPMKPLAAPSKLKLPRPLLTRSSDDLTLQDWYHGRISDELAEDRLRCGPRGDGAYLVYDDSKVQRNYILLVRKEKLILKWKIKRDEEGMYTLHEEAGNGPPDSATVKTVTTALHHHDAWNGEDTGTKQSADDSDLGLGSPDKTDKFKSFRKRSHSVPNLMSIKGSMKDVFSTKPEKSLLDRKWYHRDITHPEAETRLKQGSIDGAYLVYDFPGEANNYILLVLHEGKLLRWKISKCASDGKYVLGEDNPNTKQLKFEDVIALIKYHRGAMAQPIHAENGKKVTLSKSYVLNVPQVANEKHKEDDKGSTQEQKEDSTGGSLADRRWYHGGDITREVAESRLEKGAGDIDGSYLVYNHPNEPGNYVLLIHYRGKILRWKITKRAADGKYMLGEESEGDSGGNTPVYDNVVALIKSHRGVRGRPILLEDGLLVTLSKSYVIHPPDEDKKDPVKVKEGDQSSLVTWLHKGASAVFQTKPLHKADDESPKKKVPNSKPDSTLGDRCIDIKKYSSVVELIRAHRGLFGEKLTLSNGESVTLVKSLGIRCPES